MNIRSYKKFVRELPIGGTFYLNTINASLVIIEHTRKLVRDGVIGPGNFLIEQCVLPQGRHLYTSGEYIFPQMWYAKRKEEE